MGGCRCTFRDCGNNTANSPGMHFFHFPHRDSERCKKWATYSGNPGFTSLETGKLRNKVVCATHFRDECFMNYKKERLVQWAIPTLARLPDGTVFDYEESDEPTPKFLKPTKLEHLVPPESRQGEAASSDSTKVLRVDFMTEVLDSNSEEDTGFRTVSPSTFPPPSSPPVKLRKIRLPPPRILNISAPQNRRFQTIRIESVASKNTAAADETTFSVDEVIDESEATESCDEIFHEIHEAPETETVVTLEKPEVVLKSIYDEREQELQKEIEALKAELEQNRIELVAREAELVEAKKRAELIEKKAAAAVTVSTVTQVETITTSRGKEDSASMAQSTPAQPMPVTKAQIYNAVKKYLSPSIATLVRMEMFGGPEREWKPDEKAASVELLNLGEHVFNFVRDEWRCRLPPKRDVEQWLSQRRDVDDEEDL